MAEAMASRKRGFLFENMIKKFQKLIIIFVLLTASLVLVDRAMADSEVVNGEIAFRPIGGTVVEGYTNASNTGFAIKANLTETELDHANINLNGATVATINTKGWLEYGIDGITNVQLQTYFATGINTVELELCTTPLICSVIDTVSVTGDYIAPAVGWSFTTTMDKKALSIGDVCDFAINSSEDVSLVSATYNSRDLTLQSMITPGNYTMNYTVAETDTDQPIPLQFSGWQFADTAGNVTQIDSMGVIDFSIDTKRPIVSIASPLNGKIYKTSSLPFAYSSNETASIVNVVLDGSPIIIANSETISGLTEGDHYIKLTVIDLAGNTGVVESYFKVDITAPFVSYSLSKNDFTPNEKIILFGFTEPGSSVILNIGTRIYTAVAGVGGGWSIEVNCSEIGEGNFVPYLTLTDPAGNITTEILNQIEIKVTSTVAVQQPTTVALAASLATTDVKPSIVYAHSDNASTLKQTFAPAEKDTEEVGKIGDLIPAASDKNTNGFNWSVMLVALSIIALVSAAIVAGYYGYEFIILSNTAAGKKHAKLTESSLSDSLSTNLQDKTKTNENEPQPREQNIESGHDKTTRW